MGAITRAARSALEAAGLLKPAVEEAAPRMPPEIARPEEPLRAFHGSPHKFDKFSTEAIGTGEGAQVFGRGLYFAENEGLARYYRDTLTPRAAQQQDEAAGHLYEVEIQARRKDLLDWDVPLSDESRTRLTAVFDEIVTAPGKKSRRRRSPAEQRARRTTLSYATGGQLVKMMEDELGPERAARALREAGFAGIQFLDQRSRTAPRGTIQVRGKTLSNAARTAAEDALVDTAGDAAAAADALQVTLDRNWGSADANDPAIATWLAALPDAIKRLRAGDVTYVKPEQSRNLVVFDDETVEMIRRYGIFGTAGGGLLALGGAIGTEQAKAAEDDKPLTPDEAEESALWRRAMELGASAEAIPTAATVTASDSAPGGEPPSGSGGGRNLESLIRGETSSATPLADNLMASGSAPTRAAGLVLKHGPAVMADLMRGAQELTTLHLSENQTVGMLFDAANSINRQIDHLWDLTGNDERMLEDADAAEARGETTYAEFLRTVAGASAGGPRYPEIPEGESVTSNVARGFGEFLIIMAATRRIAPGLGKSPGAGFGARIAETGKTVVASMIADQIVFWEDGLANLVDELVETEEGALADDIIKFMRYEEDDTELERRMKIGLEGAGLGLLIDIVPSLISGIRGARHARLEAGAATEATEAGSASRGRPDDAAAPDSATSTRREAEATRQADAVQGEIQSVLGDPERELVERAASRYGEADAVGANEARALGGLHVPITADTDVVVNLSRINTSEDIRGVIRQMVDAYPEQVTAARRGVQSFGDTLHSAEEVDAFQVLLDRRVGQALNAEELVAARNLKVALATRLREFAIQAETRGSASDLYAFNRMADTYRAVMLELQGAQAEAGRALSSFRIQAAGSREAVAQIDELLQQRGGPEVIQALAGRLGRLNPAQTREFDTILDKSLGAKTVAAIEEIWLNGLLQNPVTHITNAISNGAVFVRAVAERAVMTRAARAMGKPDLAELGEAAAMVAGARAGLADAFRYAAKSMATGESGFGLQAVEGARAPATTEMLRHLGLPGGLAEAAGILSTLTFRALGGADEFFKTLNYRAELHAQAYRVAVAEARRGVLPGAQIGSRVQTIVEETTSGAREWENIRLSARNAAQENTFTKPPRKGGVTEAFLSLRGRIPIAGKVLFAFLNTPSNLVKDAWARSPLAIVMPEYKQAMRDGGRAALIANTKLATGTAMMTIVASWANSDNEFGFPVLTGGGPAEPQLRQAMLRAGWQPYSFWAMGRYWSYNRMSPMGITIGTVADLNEIVVNADVSLIGAEADEWVPAVAASIGQSIMSKTWMTGSTQMLEVFNDPERYASQFFDRTAAAFLVGNFTPTLRRWDDPYMRYTSNFLDEVKNRLPGFSASLPMRRDLWGRPVEYSSSMGKVYDAFSPFPVRVLDPEPIDSEILAQGFEGLRDPAKSITINGETVSLRNRMGVYSRIQEKIETMPGYRGMTLLEALNAAVTPPENGGDRRLNRQYMRLTSGPNSSKEAFLQNLLSTYYGAARDEVVQELVEENDPLVAEATRRAAHRNAPANRQPAFAQ